MLGANLEKRGAVFFPSKPFGRIGAIEREASRGCFIFSFFRRLDGLGLFLLGILDSSFLFLPFGNDFLLIALVSTGQGGRKWIYYVIMASAGSLIGVFLLDLVMRKAGEEGLEKFVKPRTPGRRGSKPGKKPYTSRFRISCTST